MAWERGYFLRDCSSLSRRSEVIFLFMMFLFEKVETIMLELRKFIGIY